MRRLIFGGLPCLLFASILPAQKLQSAPPASEEAYQIGEGDVLQIFVWGEPAASAPAALVRTDGKISVPLLKEVRAAGLTPSQLEKILEHQLAEFITGAKVTVTVSQMNSKKIYLVGAAKREGVMPYTQKMTVMQFLSDVGGFAPSAKRKKIYILRYENGKTYRFPFDYDAVLKGEHLEQNILLLPGDTIVFPH